MFHCIVINFITRKGVIIYDETALILRALNIKITKLCHYVLIMIYKINSNKSAIEKVLVAKKLDKVDQVNENNELNIDNETHFLPHKVTLPPYNL